MLGMRTNVPHFHDVDSTTFKHKTAGSVQNTKELTTVNLLRFNIRKEWSEKKVFNGGVCVCVCTCV